MNRKYTGLMLILMMLGHNYVINQPQSLQQEIQQIHNVNVTQFNLLYSIPSILAILTIIPVGIIYSRYPNFTLMLGITILFIGQLLASMFGAQGKQNYFTIFVGGRTLQASGAEILYMIQGNLASSWMGNFAGLVFILPEVGQIMNAFFTPYAALNWGPKTALFIGVIFCLVSMIACCYLYCELRKRAKAKLSLSTKIEMTQTQKQAVSEMQIQPPIISKPYNMDNHNQHQKLPNQQSSRQTIQEIIDNNSSANKNIKPVTEHEHKDRASDEELNSNDKSKVIQPQSIFKAGKVFWLTILICAINECLYFPFLDNANELIQMRFKIPYSETGYFLCLPFCAAILTTLSMSKVLMLMQRKNIIFYSSFLPFIGHFMIMMLPNCQQETLSIKGKLLLACGFFIFGTGIGAYYSVSFPAVGMAVPQKIRGLSYSVLCFFQTIAMSLIPIISGFIIEQDTSNEIQGYRNSSFMFVCLTGFGIAVAYLIKRFGNKYSFMYDDEEELVEEEESTVDVSSSENIELKIKNKNQTQYQVIERRKD